MRYLYLSIYLFAALSSRAQPEAAYIAAIAAHWEAVTEVQVESGRVDILTDRYAVEVERADKWKNSIGQALWYGLQTNKQAGIILLLRNKSDYK